MGSAYSVLQSSAPKTLEEIRAQRLADLEQRLRAMEGGNGYEEQEYFIGGTVYYTSHIPTYDTTGLTVEVPVGRTFIVIRAQAEMVTSGATNGSYSYAYARLWFWDSAVSVGLLAEKSALSGTTYTNQDTGYCVYHAPPGTHVLKLGYSAAVWGGGGTPPANNGVAGFQNRRLWARVF